MSLPKAALSFEIPKKKKINKKGERCVEVDDKIAD